MKKINKWLDNLDTNPGKLTAAMALFLAIGYGSFLALLTGSWILDHGMPNLTVPPTPEKTYLVRADLAAQVAMAEAAWNTFWATLFIGLGTILVSIAIFVYSYFHNKVTQDRNEKELRAYLRAILGEKIPHTIDAFGTMHIPITIENVGQTLARNLDIRVNVKFYPSGPMVPTFEPTERPKGPMWNTHAFDLKPGESTPTIGRINPKDHETFMTTPYSHHFYILGDVWYEDVFGKERHLEFGYMLTLNKERIIVPMRTPNYNSET